MFSLTFRFSFHFSGNCYCACNHVDMGGRVCLRICITCVGIHVCKCQWKSEVTKSIVTESVFTLFVETVSLLNLG